MHLKNAAQTLALTLGGIHHGLARFGSAGIDTEERQTANVRVGHDLKCQSRERRGIIRMTLLGITGLGIGAFDRRDIQRRRHIVHNRVKQLLHALVFIGCAADDGNHLDLRGRLADCGLDLFARNGFSLEIELHDLIVEVGDRFQQLLAVLLRQLAHVFRNFLNAHVFAEVVVIDVGVHLNEIDDAAEIRFLADGELDRNRVALQPFIDHVDHVVEICAHDVHLVDVDHTRDVVVIRLSPDRFGLRLDAAFGTEDGHAAIEHTQGTLDLNGEVHVTRGVDDVDAGTFPEASGRGARDGDAALLLLLHPVHGGSALMGLADLVVDAGVEQNAFRRRRLAGVDVRHDTDISCVFQGILSGHN